MSWAGIAQDRAPEIVTSEVAACKSRSQHHVLSGHQPTYLPGIILFSKIALSDVFMFCGHCDYQHRSWQSHNFIRGPLRLSVPVVKESGPSINETQIAGDHWRDKHLKSIKSAYSKRPFFNKYFPELEAVIRTPFRSLGGLNVSLIHAINHWLGIEKPIHHSSDFQIAGHKTGMLVDMCQKLQATDYLSSPGETYVDREQMRPVAHHFLKFTHPIYDQGADFMPNLSVIDLLLNCGPASGDIVRASGKLG